jgi:hypothetical protein
MELRRTRADGPFLVVADDTASGLPSLEQAEKMRIKTIITEKKNFPIAHCSLLIAHLSLSPSNNNAN